jgi:hypothetical protein
MEGYSIGRQNGWLSINDIRRLEDMSLVPVEQGGDDYLVNGNMISAKQAEGGSNGKGSKNATDDGAKD